MTFSVTRERDMVIVQIVSGGVVVKAAEHRGHMLHFWHDLGKHVIDGVEDRAKAGYGRYIEDCGRVAVNGDALPDWDGLPDKIKGHWIAAFTE